MAGILLCCRPAAIALIQPLAWESPYAAGSTLKKKKKKNAQKSGKEMTANSSNRKKLWWSII